MKHRATEKQINYEKFIPLQREGSNAIEILFKHRKSAWTTMNGVSWHCTGGSDQDHPQEKKSKKAKSLSVEALQIAKNGRAAKGKGEKESYTHLNAEFPRRARRDKKAFLRDQCKEIEEK